MLFELTFRNECVALEFNGSPSFLPAGLCSDVPLVGLVFFGGKTCSFGANTEMCIFFHLWISLWKIRTCCISPVDKCLVGAEYICR